MTPWTAPDAVFVRLDLDPAGRPRRPLVFVELAEVAPGQAAALAAEIRSDLRLVVGLARGPVPPAMAAVLDALTLTLAAEGPVGRSAVVVGDLDRAAAELARAVEANPTAAIALGLLLRQVERLDVRPALAAEAAVYSMLLGGAEFQAWLRRRGAPRPAGDESGPPVEVTREGDTLRLALNRPRRHNAFDRALREALVEGLEVALADPDLVVELSGRGASFCSGGDLDEFGSAEDAASAYLVRLDRQPGWLLHRLGGRGTALVHGACIGAGVEMAAFASRVIAAPGTRFRLPEVAMGLIPGAGGTVSLTRRAGRWRTAWMALTGREVEVGTARSWGLVDAIAG